MFNKSSTCKDGRDPTCKSCRKVIRGEQKSDYYHFDRTEGIKRRRKWMYAREIGKEKMSKSRYKYL